MNILFISLGCDKTLVDSEKIMGALISQGNTITSDIKSADIIAVNTCCFIHDALEESIETVISCGKEKRPDAKLIVFGCMAKRFHEDVKKELFEVDYIIPSADVDVIINELKNVLDLNKDSKRYLTGPGYYSYLKIADGCNKRCTYCVIPAIKGPYKSIPMEELLKEASLLASQGVRELSIVAQETTLYGVDLYGEKSLHKLIHEISLIPGIEWIRLLYAYPEEIYDELIEEIRDNKKVCHYIDIPIQHCNNRILKAMGRRATKDSITDVIKKLRREIPDICIRTTVIAGFPGETVSEHQELIDFVSEYKIDRLGCFPYSREGNTVAGDMENQHSDTIKLTRASDVMVAQQDVVLEKNRSLIGKVFKVMVEGRIVKDNMWQGRTYRDAPEVDGLIFFESDTELISGEFVDVMVTGAKNYDLVGKIYEST